MRPETNLGCFMKLRHVVLALAAVSVSTSAMAGTATAVFDVLLKINGTCKIAATPLDFGVYEDDSTSSFLNNIDKDGSVTVTCTKGTAYSVGLNAGSGVGATTDARKLTDKTDAALTVNYSLYTTSARDTVWDNACTTLPGVSTSCLSGTSADGKPLTIPVFGRIPAGQNPISVGDYKDVVTATVTF